MLSRNYSTGLGVIRSLGAAGYPVELIASTRKKGSSVIASGSKYVRRTTEVLTPNIQGDSGSGLLAALALATLVAVRNPFAPIGSEGGREEISADYHLTRAKRLAEERKAAEEAAAAKAAAAKAAAAKAAAAKDAARRVAEAEKKPAPASAPSAAENLSRPADDVAWAVAMKRIRVGGRIRARRADGTERASVILDGKPYGEGDLKSVVSGGRKFTWRVTGVEGELPKLRLERVGERKFEGKGEVR